MLLIVVKTRQGDILHGEKDSLLEAEMRLVNECQKQKGMYAMIGTDNDIIMINTQEIVYVKMREEN